MSEATSYIVWIRDLLGSIDQWAGRRAVIMQDNTSAVTIMEKGGSFRRNKHILVRYSFITEHVKNGLIAFERCPTDEHIADLLTKVQPVARLQELLSRMGWTSPRQSSEGV